MSEFERFGDFLRSVAQTANGELDPRLAELDVTKLEIGPQDFLVIRIPDDCSHEVAFAIRRWIDTNLPDLSGRSLIFFKEFDVQTLPIDSVRIIRDQLNQRIYDAEREK